MGATPVPLSASVTGSGGPPFRVGAAVNVAAASPVLPGANCTVTVHDSPARKFVPLHPSEVIVNAEDPDTVTFNAEVG